MQEAAVDGNFSWDYKWSGEEQPRLGRFPFCFDPQWGKDSSEVLMCHVVAKSSSLLGGWFEHVDQQMETSHCSSI